MQELTQNEIEEVNGGLIMVVIGIAAVAAIAVGVYIGYKDASASAHK